MSLIHVRGDLLSLAAQGEFNIIIHGCNCHNTMGAGVAKQIRERYPEAYAVDCMTAKGDRSKLGTITCVQVDNDVGGQLLIVNAYTQYDFNTGGIKDVFEYEAFQKILDAFAHDANPSMKIGMPYIGMGLAGGDRNKILSMIKDFADRVSKKGGLVSLVEYVT